MAKQPRRVRVERVREREEDADAQVRRATLDPLEVAEVLTGTLRERLLGEAAGRSETPHVRRDRREELGKFRVAGHNPSLRTCLVDD